jgi:hypothetical protein
MTVKPTQVIPEATWSRKGFFKVIKLKYAPYYKKIKKSSNTLLSFFKGVKLKYLTAITKLYPIKALKR